MSGTRTASKARTLRLRLYVAGESPNSLAATRNLRALLASRDALRTEFEIIDVLKEPGKGVRDGVLVTPTMIKLAPGPERRIIGNLSDAAALASVLGLTDDRE